jgi:hypothetical protein
MIQGASGLGLNWWSFAPVSGMAAVEAITDQSTVKRSGRKCPVAIVTQLRFGKIRRLTEMRMSTLRAGFFLLTSGIFTTLPAAVYEYHPLSVLRLGGGFDPRTPTDPKVCQCVAFTGERNVDTATGAVATGISLTMIRSRQELLTSLGMSTSFDAHYNFGGGGGVSAGGSFGQISQTSFTDDSLTWVAHASITLGRFQVEGFNLGPDGKKLLALPPTERAGELIAACGTETVTQETRGALAAVYYHVDYLDTATKSQLEQAITAAASSPTAGGSASTSYRQAIQTASQRGILNFVVFTQGGPGQNLLSDALLDVTDIDAIRKALTKYIRDVSSSNAKALLWQTSSNSAFGLPTQSAVFTHRDQVLERFNDVYREIAALNSRIYELIRPASTPQLDYLPRYVSPSKRAELASIYAKNQQFETRLFNTAIECLKDTAKCDVPPWVTLPTVTWPDIPPALSIVFQRVCEDLFATVTGHIPQPGEREGKTIYLGYVSGDETIFDRLDVVVGGTRFPVEVSPLTLENSVWSRVGGCTILVIVYRGEVVC